MGQFAGILLEVNAADADRLFIRGGINGEQTVLRERRFILGDLITFGEVGVEVILAGKNADGVEGAVQGKRNFYPIFNRRTIDHRQRTWQTEADWANGSVGLGSGGIDLCTTAEHFGLCLQFGVHFETDVSEIFHFRIASTPGSSWLWR